MEQEHLCLKELHIRIPSRINNWTELLDTNQEGKPIYPEAGQGESRYRPDNQEIIRENSLSEDVLNSSRDKLAHFIASLSAEDHSLLVGEITLPCLKNLEAIKAYVGDEDGICTIIEGQINAGNKIPQPKYSSYSLSSMFSKKLKGIFKVCQARGTKSSDLEGKIK